MSWQPIQLPDAGAHIADTYERSGENIANMITGAFQNYQRTNLEKDRLKAQKLKDQWEQNRADKLDFKAASDQAIEDYHAGKIDEKELNRRLGAFGAQGAPGAPPTQQSIPTPPKAQGGSPLPDGAEAQVNPRMAAPQSPAMPAPAENGNLGGEQQGDNPEGAAAQIVPPGPSPQAPQPPPSLAQKVGGPGAPQAPAGAPPDRNAQLAQNLLHFSRGGQQFDVESRDAYHARQETMADADRAKSVADWDKVVASTKDPRVKEYGPAVRDMLAAGANDKAMGLIASLSEKDAARTQSASDKNLARQEKWDIAEGGWKQSDINNRRLTSAMIAANRNRGENPTKIRAEANTELTTFWRDVDAKTLVKTDRNARAALAELSSDSATRQAQGLDKLIVAARGGQAAPTSGQVFLFLSHAAGGEDKVPQLWEDFKTGGFDDTRKANLVGAAKSTVAESANNWGSVASGSYRSLGPRSGMDTPETRSKFAGKFKSGTGVVPLWTTPKGHADALNLEAIIDSNASDEEKARAQQLLNHITTSVVDE